MHCVDLGESFTTHIYFQNFVSIQPRTSPVKFVRLGWTRGGGAAALPLAYFLRPAPDVAYEVPAAGEEVPRSRILNCVNAKAPEKKCQKAIVHFLKKRRGGLTGRMCVDASSP